MSARRMRVWGVVAASSFLFAQQANAYLQNRGVTTEAVDTYGSCGPDLANNRANVDGLHDQLVTATGTFFRTGVRYTELNVWDTDFLDGNVTGQTGSDHLYFDKAYNYTTDRGNSIGMYSGHGMCDDVSTTTCAVYFSTCSSPPSGMTLPGVCMPNSPGNTLGKCVYTSPRRAVVNCSNPNNSYGGFIDYTSGGARFGERSGSPWTGFGTNGALNFVIMDISCPVRHHALWQELGNSFAGLHTFATIFMTAPTSDTADSSDRGSAFGMQFTANSNASIAASWTVALNSVTTGGGTHGINGYGAHSAVSAGANATNSYYYRDTESFDAIRTESAATGPYGWWSDRWNCNYDCSTHPIP